MLSGTASTFVWEYSFSSLYLPLLPALFTEGTGSIADHTTPLTISWWVDRYGYGAWQIFFDEVTTLESVGYDLSTLGGVDLSLASLYSVRVIDPQGSETEFDYRVIAWLPSSILSLGSYRHITFCSTYPTSSLCPDGASLSATSLWVTSGPQVADGSAKYDFILKLRDTYGNAIENWSIHIEYRDNIRTIQADPVEYMNTWADSCISGTCGLITSGILTNTYDGRPSTGYIPVLGWLSYSIAAIAPTSTTDTVSLSGITYRDKNGIDYDITLPSWKNPLLFTPWYTTALSASPIIVGWDTRFVSTFWSSVMTLPPDDPRAIYHIDIGSNSLSSYQDYTPPYNCTKYIGDIGVGECDWFIDSSIISTDSPTFTGTYTAWWWYDPPPEAVIYRSYIRYSTGGITVLYPSGLSSLGTALAWPEYMKVLGAQNLGWSSSAIKEEWATNIWNTLRKNIALLSRNRSDFSGADYIVYTGDQTVTDTDLTSRRTIVVVGGDITLTSDITSRTAPVALIALTDDAGNGGEIIIDPSVRDIEASLYAEKVVTSTGANQLYVRGSVISHNTVSSSKCPYYVSWVCDPNLYNLQKIREAYLDLVDKTWYTASSSRAIEYPGVSVVIEYDGRVISDTPPGLDR
jgi:hypothetical protein